MGQTNRLPPFLFAVAMALALLTAGRATAGPLAPENALATHDALRLRCKIVVLCPYSEEIWNTLEKAVAGASGDEYMLGIYLMTGDKVGLDSAGGTAWLGVAATQGYATAALELNRQRRGGAEMTVDEPAIARAMRKQTDTGNLDAMRALAVLYLDGRGVERDPTEALRLLHRAADGGSGEAEEDLAILLLRGGPGVPANREEALRWLARSGSHGNTDAMLTVSYQLDDTSTGAKPQPVESYRWLMRAALLDKPEAQERLAGLFVRGLNADGGPAQTQSAMPPRNPAADEAMLKTLERMNPLLRDKARAMIEPRAPAPLVVAPDLIEADKWFLLAARDPYHDNPSVRASIEPHLTTAELTQARQEIALWRRLPLSEVMAIDIPPPDKPAHAK